ncbi:hypothetical protein FP744_10003484 [Trichoderma asperellum]
MHALDECAESEFEDLVKNVERQFSYNQKSYGKFKYLLTCRPYEQIVSSFGSLLSTFPYIRIPGEEESDAISREVDLVITHQVRLLARDKLLSLQIRNELEKGLQQATNRTYLWIYLIFDYLRKENFKKTQKAVMSIIMTLPKTVNEAYNQILTKSKDIIIARKALNIVLGASQPLTVPQMNIAVNIDSQSIHDLDLEDNKDFETRLRSSCGLFISIYRGKIYFLHQTAREFLVNTALPTELPVVTLPKLLWHRSISMRDAHAVLAEICVLYLNSLDGDLSLSTDAISDGNRALHDDDFLDYSASFWGAHFHEAKFEDGDTILPLALRICNPTSKSFSKWFKLQSIHYEEGKKANPMRFTKLMVAAYFGHHVLVKLLLQQGADIEAKDDQGQTSLLWASINGHVAVVNMLLDNGADVQVKDVYRSRTPLWCALAAHSIDVFKILLDKGVDVEEKDKYGWTPLLWAASEGHEVNVVLLLKNGVNIEAKDKNSRTPLLWAASGGHKAIVNLLLKNNAEVDVKDNNGWTPLLWASIKSHKTVMKLLLEKGADVNAKTHDSHTSLSSAVSMGLSIGIIRLLLKMGADTEMKDDEYGWTSLCWATVRGYRAIVQRLVENGADLTAKDNCDRTPLSYSTTRK